MAFYKPGRLEENKCWDEEFRLFLVGGEFDGPCSIDFMNSQPQKLLMTASV